MTIGLWVTAIVVGIIGIVATVLISSGSYNIGATLVVGLLITAIVVGGIIGIGYWYCNNTAGGVRALKDQQSALNNGLNREIIITAEDGREIFYYKGKCDIETTDGYILFEGEDGLRRMIYYGALDTIIVVELP
jgi:hypothetical protein